MELFGRFVLADVVEHENGTEHEAGGVGEVLAGATGSGAVNGFEHGAADANVGGADEADAASDLGCDVGEDVSVEVGEDDDVEELGFVGQLGGADVDDPVLVLDFWIVFCDLVEDLVELAVGELHDVVFREARDFFTAVFTGVFEGVVDDPLGGGGGDDLDSGIGLRGLVVFDAGVEIFLVLADNDDVHAGVFSGDIGGIGDGGADVGVEAEGGADGDVERSEAATLRGGDRCF